MHQGLSPPPPPAWHRSDFTSLHGPPPPPVCPRATAQDFGGDSSWRWAERVCRLRVSGAQQLAYWGCAGCCGGRLTVVVVYTPPPPPPRLQHQPPQPLVCNACCRSTPVMALPDRPCHPRHIQHSPGAPTTGLRERGNYTGRSTGRGGRQNAATRRSTRREERGTVQGPRKESTTRRNVTRGVVFDGVGAIPHPHDRPLGRWNRAGPGIGPAALGWGPGGGGAAAVEGGQ